MIFQVRFEDLSFPCQQRLLAWLGVNHPSECGYDRQPVCEIQHPDVIGEYHPHHNEIHEVVEIEADGDVEITQYDRYGRPIGRREFDFD